LLRSSFYIAGAFVKVRHSNLVNKFGGSLQDGSLVKSREQNKMHHISSNASIECAVASSPEDRAHVYRLRYECYRRSGAIDVRPDGEFSDRFDELPNSFSILARAAESVLATVRVTVTRPDYGWDDSPVKHVYGDEPQLESIARESFVEASRLCFGQQARRDAFVRLLGYMAALAEFYDVSWLIACPRVEHAKVYQRMFGFRPLAEPRQYYGVNFKTQLLGVKREEISAYVRDARPMVQAWSDALALLSSSNMLPLLGSAFA